MFYSPDSSWTERCENAKSAIIQRFGGDGITEDGFGFVALRETGRGCAPVGYAHNGDWHCYPCSLVKAFHLVHVLKVLEDETANAPVDLDDAIRDMIMWSSNTATNYVIDFVTGTTGDTYLAPDDYARWQNRREGVNRFFEDLEWPEWHGCNLNQKLNGDIRYGREAQLAGPDGSYLNSLTPHACARLFHELFCGALPLSDTSRARAQATLKRDRNGPDAGLPAYQLAEYLGAGMPREAEVWSKGGFTPWTGDPRTSFYRHDLMRVVMPDAAPVVLAIMTRGEQISDNGPRVFPLIGALLADMLLDAR